MSRKLMFLAPLLAFSSALICAALAAVALWRDRRSFAHVAFALGMIVLGLKEGLTAVGALTIVPQEVLRWRYLRVLVTALLPGAWLVFSLSFGRANYAEYLTKWKWLIFATFVLPLALAIGFGAAFFVKEPSLEEETLTWFLQVGWSGWGFHILFLLGAVSVLVNLEGTLREFKGSLRWKIKFIVLGIGCVVAVQVYTASQVILFSGVNTALDAVESAVLVIASVLLTIAFVRSPTFNVDLYVSQKVLYNSLTALVIGLYLVVVGGLGKLASYVGGNHALVVASFVVFVALLGLVTFLLADEFREKLKSFINRNFHRPRYDYRREWMRFTERTASVLEIKEFCASVAAMASQTFGVGSVSIFLLDESKRQLTLSGSTVFAVAERQRLKLAGKATADFLRALREYAATIDFDRPDSGWPDELKSFRPDFPPDAQVRYCAPLIANGQLMGVMTLSDRITKEPFALEDFDLHKAICDQTAANVLNLRLSQEIVQAKELEAFQSFSAFFVHDLKNLASTLSMTVSNFEIHFGNPDFRKDALRAMSQSVGRINAVCQGIALMGKQLELRRTKVDLNRLVSEVRSQLNGSLKAPISLELQPVPELSLDTEQIEKVLVNLLLNANDATPAEGQIQVRTGWHNGWITISVSDNGCGMAEEFIAGSLFRPFRTSKLHGLGIGLFHSKKIVESHQGKIEVESAVGKGSTFKVLLPVGDGQG